MKKRMLLHSCCGPCSSGVIGQLVDEYDITIYYYNPNIQPEQEYQKRYDAQKILVDKMNEEYGWQVQLVEEGYHGEVFENSVKGLEEEPEGGRRCPVCFKLRLEATAKYAKNNNFDIFTTTLSVSPHKDYELINSIGDAVSKKLDIEYLPANFKKKDGYLNSIKNSKKYNIYRQDYCGCLYGKPKN